MLLSTLTKAYKTEQTKKHPRKHKELKNKIVQSFPSLVKLPPPLLKEKKYTFLLKQPLCFSIILLKISFIFLLKKSLVGIIKVTAIGINIISMGVKSSFHPHTQGWDRESASLYTGTHSPCTAHVRMKQSLPCPVLSLGDFLALVENASNACIGLLQLSRASQASK